MNPPNINQRPLSPHLSIYKQEWTMRYSITHRFTGMGLSLGLAVFVCWLLALSMGEAAYMMFTNCLASVPGRVILFLISFCYAYHFCNGIRHLFWDIGKGFELQQAARSGHIMLGLSLITTIGFWVLAYLCQEGGFIYAG